MFLISRRPRQRFQPVMVDQPTVEDTISILRGIKDRYEVYHGVNITASSLVAAATLSNRYSTDRFLPDKAMISPVAVKEATTWVEVPLALLAAFLILIMFLGILSPFRQRLECGRPYPY